jgi:hypothetical protein
MMREIDCRLRSGERKKLKERDNSRRNIGSAVNFTEQNGFRHGNCLKLASLMMKLTYSAPNSSFPREST